MLVSLSTRTQPYIQTGGAFTIARNCRIELKGNLSIVMEDNVARKQDSISNIIFKLSGRLTVFFFSSTTQLFSREERCKNCIATPDVKSYECCVL